MLFRFTSTKRSKQTAADSKAAVALDQKANNGDSSTCELSQDFTVVVPSDWRSSCLDDSDSQDEDRSETVVQFASIQSMKSDSTLQHILDEQRNTADTSQQWTASEKIEALRVIGDALSKHNFKLYYITDLINEQTEFLREYAGKAGLVPCMTQILHLEKEKEAVFQAIAALESLKEHVLFTSDHKLSFELTIDFVKRQEDVGMTAAADDESDNNLEKMTSKEIYHEACTRLLARFMLSQRC